MMPKAQSIARSRGPSRGHGNHTARQSFFALAFKPEPPDCNLVVASDRRRAGLHALFAKCGHSFGRKSHSVAPVARVPRFFSPSRLEEWPGRCRCYAAGRTRERGDRAGGAQQSGASNPFTAEQLDQIEGMIDKAVTERTAHPHLRRHPGAVRDRRPHSYD
jgi:hypothetical protein